MPRDRSSARAGNGRPMLLRVCAVNVLVLATAAVVLALSPATVSSPIVFAEAAALFAGFVLLVIANPILLRREFAGLRELTSFMDRVDLMRPGPRVPVSGQNREVAQLSHASNATLDTLSEKTVEHHRSKALAKLGMRGRVGLTRYAIRRGLIEP